MKTTKIFTPDRRPAADATEIRSWRKGPEIKPEAPTQQTPRPLTSKAPASKPTGK